MRRSLLLTGVALIFIVPTSASAADGADTRFEKNGSTSNPNVDFSVGSGGSSSSSPSRGGSSGSSQQGLGGLIDNVIGAATPRPPAFDHLANQCRSTVDESGAGTVPVPCRSVDPDDPDAPDAPGGAAPQPVDAAALAQEAAGQLNLPTPQLNTSPADPVKALVGLQTWLWVPQGQWSTLNESASAGGATVTVTAEPTQSRWDMGEGSVNCAGPGREWRKGLGQSAKTSCGYTYENTSVSQPDKKYAVSATLRYRITWTCDGNCSEDAGDLGTLDSATSTGQLQVSERQSVVVQ